MSDDGVNYGSYSSPASNSGTGLDLHPVGKIQFNIQDKAGVNTKKYYILQVCDVASNCDNYKVSVYVDSIPEFPTVALPIAAVIGLVFLFQQKKRKEE